MPEKDSILFILNDLEGNEHPEKLILIDKEGTKDFMPNSIRNQSKNIFETIYRFNLSYHSVTTVNASARFNEVLKKAHDLDMLGLKLHKNLFELNNREVLYCDLRFCKSQSWEQIDERLGMAYSTQKAHYADVADKYKIDKTFKGGARANQCSIIYNNDFFGGIDPRNYA